MRKKTKIICTMGPATDRPGVLDALIAGGMNCARFNFSHGTHEEQRGRIEAVRAAAKKAGGFLVAANGIVGLETAVAVTWHVMVEEEGMSPLEWTRRWTVGPAALVKKPLSGRTVIDLQANRAVDAAAFRSKSRNQPYAGRMFSAWPISMQKDEKML